jgi:tight adherence protein B
MTGVLLAMAGAYGVYLLYTSAAFGWRGVGVSPRIEAGRRPRPLAQWLAEAGLDGVRPLEFVAVTALLFLIGAGVAFALFGGPLPAIALGSFAASAPIASHRARRQRRRDKARDGWPRMLEEVRLLTGSLGRSIPNALFEVGRNGPEEMRGSFAAAQRDWLISTDFARTIGVLKAKLADPTADAACETLLVAHEIGGSDVDRRLAALVDDRIADVQGRKDALAKQAGVRFARRFTLFVPLGMAMAGLTIGDGRAAYQTGLGQAAAVVGIATVVGCWLWAGRIMRLPEEERVFPE